MKRTNCIKFLFFISVLHLASLELSAQAAAVEKIKKEELVDSSFIETFHQQISGRIYLSQKSTELIIEEIDYDLLLEYKPNTTINFGVGATYHGFSLNLAYGFGFLNQEREKGKTRYLDLQTHMYRRKYAADIFGQFYRGMYLDNTADLLSNYPQPYYLRPDISILIFGASYFRLVNHQKFSYAASMLQNEWQKKSAGSFLWGGKFLTMAATTDSSLVPPFKGDSIFISYDEIKGISSIQFGPGIGYAHTFVIAKNYFITASLNSSLLIGPVKYQIVELKSISEWQINPSFDLRLAIGYNSRNSYFGLSMVQEQSGLRTVDDRISTRFVVGNVRLNYVRRFPPSKKLKAILDKLPI